MAKPISGAITSKPKKHMKGILLKAEETIPEINAIQNEIIEEAKR